MAIIYKEIKPDQSRLEATDQEIQVIFENSHTVAVVGGSKKQGKPSYEIPIFLKENGYLLMPITTRENEVYGEKAFPALEEIVEPIDIVLTFRSASELPNLVRRAATAGAKTIWAHEGIENPEAAKVAHLHGLHIVMNKCMRREFNRWFRD